MYETQGYVSAITILVLISVTHIAKSELTRHHLL